MSEYLIKVSLTHCIMIYFFYILLYFIVDYNGRLDLLLKSFKMYH